MTAQARVGGAGRAPRHVAEGQPAFCGQDLSFCVEDRGKPKEGVMLPNLWFKTILAVVCGG